MVPNTGLSLDQELMKRSMFDPSDRYPDTCLDTYDYIRPQRPIRQELSTSKHTPKHTGLRLLISRCRQTSPSLTLGVVYVQTSLNMTAFLAKKHDG